MTSATNTKEFFGHPRGLFVLFFTEMWERFSYYGMRAILVLYLVSQTDAANAGLGWANDSALALYGWYTMLVYVASIPGGWLADKFFGQKKSVLYGGILLVIGHSVLAIEEMWAFYSGLSLIIAGVGMLKPNISTMVGGLYKPGDIRRDKGFTIFYIGINLGAFLSSLIVGYVGEVMGWHYGFGLAGIGMTLGLIQYVLGQKYLKDVGNYIGASKDEEEIAREVADVLAYHGVRIEKNPTRHGATRGHCVYFFDPAGNRNEAFTGGYWVDPDEPPVTWTESEMGRAIFYYDGVVNQRFLTVHS